MTSPTVEVVVLDLDGVVRHFDKSRVPAIEARHGLAEGSLRGTAFAPQLLNLAITGEITRAEWTRRVGEVVGSVEAAEEWLGHRGFIDAEIIAMVRDVRAGGRRAAVLTNGTEDVAGELAQLDVAHEFDAIFTTALIGYAKPDRRAYEHVCRALEVDPRAVFYTDDTPGKLAGAIELGIDAVPFESVDLLRTQLTERGVLVAGSPTR